MTVKEARPEGYLTKTKFPPNNKCSIFSMLRRSKLKFAESIVLMSIKTCKYELSVLSDHVTFLISQFNLVKKKSQKCWTLRVFERKSYALRFFSRHFGALSGKYYIFSIRSLGEPPLKEDFLWDRFGRPYQFQPLPYWVFSEIFRWKHIPHFLSNPKICIFSREGMFFLKISEDPVLSVYGKL